ncbi:MAG: FAD-dependent oxidoreductase [Clostridiales bacterium]|nr:FAD-dependent oxidoreductase [Clostridiales bacterium]
MKISDLSGLFKKTIASFDSVENPFDDYYLVRLIPAPGVNWTPGEHGIFRLPRKDVKGCHLRPFSVASISEEGIILIGTRTGKTISPYKDRLLHLEKGAPVTMNGPFGWFKIKDETSPVVLFAAGVGITPIRAILLQLRNDTSRPIDIVYASEGRYLFDDEIASLVRGNPQMTLHKTTDPESTRAQLSALTEKHGNGAYYFISASPSVVRSIRLHLKSNDIRGKRIVDDTFWGY